MTMRRISCLAVLAFAATIGAAASQELRVGLLTDYSGPGALQSTHTRNGWQIGLAHEGWTKDGDPLGGVPMRLFFADDQTKPDIGMREVNRLLLAARVHVIAGFLGANVLLPTVTPIVESKRIILSVNSGPVQMAGVQCSPYFVTTASQNEQVPEAVGKLASDSGIKSIYVLVPNYQGGREIAAGFRRSFTGTVVGQTFYKLGEADFQAEISAVRNAKPDGIFLFAPGGMGIAFMKQWQASMAGSPIKIYSAFSIDHLTLPAIGDAAMGSFHIYPWDPNSTSEPNPSFIKDYVAKYSHKPSDFAALAYDGARLLAAAVRAVGGNVDDTLALAKAMRKTPYPSLRGTHAYNVNGYPIMNFYSREVVNGPDGKPMIATRGVVMRDFKDAYWEQCPVENRH